MVLAQYQRFFSVQFVKVQAACLTARLGHLSDGARQAARRRVDLMDQEERARRGGQAFFMAYVKGRGGRCGGEGVCVRGRRREEN